MTIQDRPVRDGEMTASKVKKSVPDILRMVRESLGDEGIRRLEEDGVGLVNGGRRRQSGKVL